MAICKYCKEEHSKYYGTSRYFSDCDPHLLHDHIDLLENMINIAIDIMFAHVEDCPYFYANIWTKESMECDCKTCIKEKYTKEKRINCWKNYFEWKIKNERT